MKPPNPETQIYQPPIAQSFIINSKRSRGEFSLSRFPQSRYTIYICICILVCLYSPSCSTRKSLAIYFVHEPECYVSVREFCFQVTHAHRLPPVLRPPLPTTINRTLSGNDQTLHDANSHFPTPPPNHPTRVPHYTRSSSFKTQTNSAILETHANSNRTLVQHDILSLTNNICTPTPPPLYSPPTLLLFNSNSYSSKTKKKIIDFEYLARVSLRGKTPMKTNSYITFFTHSATDDPTLVAILCAGTSFWHGERRGGAIHKQNTFNKITSTLEEIMGKGGQGCSEAKPKYTLSGRNIMTSSTAQCINTFWGRRQRKQIARTQ